MAWNGRYLVVGFTDGAIPRIPLNLPLLKGCSLIGVLWHTFSERHPTEAIEDFREMADWIAVNGDGIYGTRPWSVYGEGPTKAQGGNFKEDFAYSVRDIRFTTKGNRTLYAFALGWPDDRKLTIRSLAKLAGETGAIEGVRLLGDSGRLTFNHTADGLTVDLPSRRPSKYAVCLKITVSDLHGFRPEVDRGRAAGDVRP